jgi:hypothetical protein
MVVRLQKLKNNFCRPVLQEKLMENGGTEGAPRGDGPSLKKYTVQANEVRSK